MITISKGEVRNAGGAEMTAALRAGRGSPAPPAGRGSPAPSAGGGPEGAGPAGVPRPRYVPLFRRVAGMNALLLVAAVVVTILVLDPDRISSFELNVEVFVLLAGLGLVGCVNLYLLRRFIRPLQALTALARHVDLSNPGQRMPGAEPRSEAGELALTFNEMLDRLEAERRDATGRVLAAQEAERLRIAQELHDQVGQELTGVLLILSRLQANVPTELRADVSEVQDEVRASLEDLRRIALELRPEALDDLGLVSALAVLGQRFAQRSALEVVEQIAPDLPPLTPEMELVVYRVAQEALTNVVRHSGSRRAELQLECNDGHVTLIVRDQGRGLPDGLAPGTGIRGMRERASLIGATLHVSAPSPGGCEIRLEIPLGAVR
jgi:two-component system, NarL family, sensor histidine kinase UhpB